MPFDLRDADDESVLDLPLVDFHSHTRLSDGRHELAEWVDLAAANGYRVLGVSDHVGLHNVGQQVRRLCAQIAALPPRTDGVQVLAGCEITRVAPELIADVAARAREAGAQIVIVHGETGMDLPAPGVNRGAIEARVDILAHPGLIGAAEVERAAELGVLLELSGRPVHSLTNGHVWQLARHFGARVVIDSDSHTAADLFTAARRRLVARGAGLSDSEYRAAAQAACELAGRALGSPLFASGDAS